MELDLRDIFKILRKRIWWIVILPVLASAASWVYSTYYLKPVYQASTKLIVKQSGGAVSGIDLNEVNLNLRLIDTYKEIIRTLAIMQVVADRHPEFGLTAEQLIERVRVSSVNNTQVMTLIVEDSSYRRAAEIVNAVSYVFKEEIPKIMHVDNVSILNEAPLDIQPDPVRPNVQLNVAVAFVVALMAVIGWAFLMEYLDDTIKSEQDVQDVLALPTLTVVARIETQDLVLHAAGQPKRKVADTHGAAN